MTEEVPVQKIVTKEEIAEVILHQLKAIMEPATQQIGRNLLAFHERLVECEKYLNTLTIEMQEWKAKSQGMN